MKKVLLATTAMVMSAGVAYAEVSISGDARMGLVYTGKVAGTAAVQGVHTAATASAASAVAGAVVTGAQMLTLQTDAASTALTAANALTAYTTANGSALAAAELALSSATAAQDAAAIAAATTALTAAQTTAAASNTGLALAAANTAAATAAGLVAAASGTAAVPDVDSKIVLEKRMNVYMNAAVETTSGLTFGASVMIRSNEGATMMNGARVHMATNGFEVGVGNINGAIEWMPNLYNPVGLTGLGFDNVGNTVARAGKWDAYSSSSNGAEGIEVIYSAGGFTGHMSYSDETLSKGSSSHKRVAGVLAYAMGDWTVALGMQDSEVDTEDKTIVTVGGKVGDYGVKFAAANNDGVQKISLAGSATMGATTISATISNDESAADNYMGLGLSHDLGGAALKAGVARTTSGNTIADMGVSFSF